ncbi:hypothetical protein FGO68_gene13953 [Halteria grandinella]|uniref:Uncharacterized protein n=1 Tax=Halteria grandinella TaxID=5974 RepID=A0A8J8NVW4_HALGN|nr:hypothetical protein FGO68_gene13953 [Halteria grandinella]
MCQASRYKRVFGKEGDSYIFTTFLLLAISQFLFGAYETIWALYFVIYTTEQTDSLWGKSILDFYSLHFEMILKVCDFCQIFGYALQTTAFLINIKRWEALLLTKTLTELNDKLEKETEAALFDSRIFEGQKAQRAQSRRKESIFMKPISAMWRGFIKFLDIFISVLFMIQFVYVGFLIYLSYEANYDVWNFISIWYRSIFIPLFLSACYVYIYKMVVQRHKNEMKESIISNKEKSHQLWEIFMYFLFIWQYLIIDAYINIFGYLVPVEPGILRVIHLQQISLLFPSRIILLLGLTSTLRKAVKTQEQIKEYEESTKAVFAKIMPEGWDQDNNEGNLSVSNQRNFHESKGKSHNSHFSLASLFRDTTRSGHQYQSEGSSSTSILYGGVKHQKDQLIALRANAQAQQQIYFGTEGVKRGHDSIDELWDDNGSDDGHRSVGSIDSPRMSI